MRAIKEHMQCFVLKDIAATQADHYRRFKLKKSTEKLDYLFFFHRVSTYFIFPYHVVRFVQGSTFPDFFLLLVMLILGAPINLIEGLRFSTSYAKLTSWMMYAWTAMTIVGHTIASGLDDLALDPLILPIFANTFAILNFTERWHDCLIAFGSCVVAIGASFLIYFGPTDMVLRTCFVMAMLVLTYGIFSFEDEKNTRENFLQELRMRNIGLSFKGKRPIRCGILIFCRFIK